MTLGKKIVAAMLLLLGMSVAAYADSHNKMKIRIGTEGAYPPFNHYDSAGNLTGFDVEIGKALCAELKAECEFVTQEWDGMIPALQAGKYDVILASMYITDERLKQVDFTDPYYKAAAGIAAPKGAGLTLTPAGLKGKVIGVQSATTGYDYAVSTYPNAEVRPYRTQDEANMDLSNGRIDLTIADLLPLMDWLKTGDGGCCEMVGAPITDPKFVGYGAGMAVRKGDDKLRQALNKALAAILANGEYDRINDKYFDINIYSMK